MQWEIRFVEGEVPDALVKVSGPMTVEGNRAWLAELVGDPKWRPGMRTLVDGRGLLTADFAGEDVKAVADPTVAQADSWGAGRSAVVVDNPAVFGMLRMWQAATRRMEWRTEIFYSREDALAWLAAEI